MRQIDSIVVTPSISSLSKSLKFFAMVHQVTSGISSFSRCLEFFSESSVPLVVFDVRSSRNLIYLLFLSLGVMPSECDALICLLHIMSSLDR